MRCAKGIGIKPAAVVRLPALSGFFKALLYCAHPAHDLLQSSKVETFCGVQKGLEQRRRRSGKELA